MRECDIVDACILAHPSVDTLEQQLERAYAQYKERQSDIHKNSFLQSMKCKSSPQAICRSERVGLMMSSKLGAFLCVVN